MENKGFQALETSVIKKDLCTFCGACLSLCSLYAILEGKWVKLDNCDLTEGVVLPTAPYPGGSGNPASGSLWTKLLEH
jgi:ferredoxin